MFVIFIRLFIQSVCNNFSFAVRKVIKMVSNDFEHCRVEVSEVSADAVGAAGAAGAVGAAGAAYQLMFQNDFESFLMRIGSRRSRN